MITCSDAKYGTEKSTFFLRSSVTDIPAAIKSIAPELRAGIKESNSMFTTSSFASVQLDTRVPNLLFEVIEKGSDGFMGLGKKPWKLQIYQNPETLNKTQKLASDGLISENSFNEGVVNKNHDGLFFVRHFGSDILLKVRVTVPDV